MKLSLSVKRKLFIYMALIIVVKGDLFAQDPHFSQFYANPMYINPAFAGSTNHGRIVTNARNQWSSIAGTFTTMSASSPRRSIVPLVLIDVPTVRLGDIPVS